jgi:hypothetical protein
MQHAGRCKKEVNAIMPVDLRINEAQISLVDRKVARRVCSRFSEKRYQFV